MLLILSFVNSLTGLPVFHKELVDMSITEGETVSLEVVIRNGSNCQLEWFKDDTALKEGGRLSFHNNGDGRYSLTIRDTEDDDSGEYCCAVQNEAGRITCTTKLSVQGKDVLQWWSEFGHTS